MTAVVTRKSLRITIYDLLFDARDNHSRYPEGKSLYRLESLTHGYMAALWQHGVVEDEVPPMEPFLLWLAFCKPGLPWNFGWATALTEDEPQNEDVAFDRFFELLTEFASFKPHLVAEVKLSPTAERSAMHCRYHKPSEPIPGRVELYRLTPRHVYFCQYVFESNTRRPQQIVYAGIDSAINSQCEILALKRSSWSIHDDPDYG